MWDEDQLVERGALEVFLERIAESENPEKAIQSLCESEAPISEKRLRHLIQQDEIPATLDTLPINVKLERRTLQVTFTDIADLAQSLYRMAQAMDGDVEECKERFNPPQSIMEVDRWRPMSQPRSLNSSAWKVRKLLSIQETEGKR